jgi:tyrosine recombinase XerC
MHRHIREYIKHIKLERRYSNHTVDAYQTDLIQFEYFLRDFFKKDTIDWQLVTKRHVRQYLGYLVSAGIKKISIARKLAALKSFFAFLTQQKILEVNPTRTLKTPKYEKRLPEFLSIQHLEKLMDMPPDDSFEGLRDRAILELFYATGIRRAELIDIRIKDLLLNEGLVRVRGKGEKERVVPIGSYAKERLEKYLSLRESYVNHEIENVFVLKSGEKMYSMAIHRIIGKYLQKVSDIKKKSPHILRHSFATHLMNQGADIRAVKDLLGHENLSTTQIYTHTSIDHLKSIYTRTHPGASEKSHKK